MSKYKVKKKVVSGEHYIEHQHQVDDFLRIPFFHVHFTFRRLTIVNLLESGSFMEPSLK